jgi:hypothetical protein
MKVLIYMVLIVLLYGCGNHPENNNSRPVARVFNKYLYTSDLTDVVPSGISSDDSTSITKDFIEKWIRNQLLLNKAEMNLTDDEKNVKQQIENYRSSLLIYTYQQSYIRQKLDTFVTDKEITDYYKQNQSNFILGETLIKGLFIKIPVNTPDIYKLRQWYRSNDEESIKNMEGYCFKYAVTYDHFDDGWVNLSYVLHMLPVISNSYESTLSSRKYLETRDNSYFYFLHINEIAAAGTGTPLELVKNNINSIILNKRKINLIHELESNIYLDAQNHEHFDIYQ